MGRSRSCRRYWPALLWALVVAFLAVQLVARLSPSAFDTSILALLPQDEQQPVVDRAMDRMDSFVANRVMLLIGGDHADRAALRALADRAADSLSDSGAFTSVTVRAKAGWLAEMSAVYQPYRYQLLSEETAVKLASGKTETLVARAAREMVNPIGRPRPASVVDDPLNLLGIWLESLTPAVGFSVDEHGLYARDGDRHYRVITAVFAGDSFDHTTQKQVLDAVQAAGKRVEQSAAANSFLRSGVVFHAAAGAEQARNELSTIGAGSVLAIVLLLLWQFRSLAYLLLPIISIGVGLLVALSVSLMVFGRVHLVTLAFGASLVGVSVDYAFHYLCHARYCPKERPSRILPGIALGLASSCLAYGAQALTPFPGLRQIALFSAAGLVGAWVTVVLWFPLVRSRLSTSQAAGPLARGLGALARFRSVLAGLLVALILLALAGIPTLNFDDSLAALRSSPADLVDEEQQVQQLSENPGSARFLLVEGASVQQILEREEQARVILEQMVADDRLQAYQSVSGFVPSIKRQQDHRALIESAVYDGALPEALFESLGMPQELAGRSVSRFENHQPGWLLPEELRETPIADMMASLWLADSDGNGAVASIITIGGASGPEVYAQLRDMADDLDGIRFVDRVGQTSALLGDYRITVSQWMALAYGLVLLVLVARYGWQCWQVVLPPALATVVTLGLLSALGQPLNLFNLLATLLILGIGLDIGIFVRESNGERHAWEAVTLSAITSLLAFGLLALSETPVLHHFGVTILPGIALAWLIAFVLQRRTQG